MTDGKGLKFNFPYSSILYWQLLMSKRIGSDLFLNNKTVGAILRNTDIF